MRISLACTAVLSSVIIAGCGDLRDSMMTVPDRGGHASRDPTTTHSGGPTNTPIADPKREMYITLGAGDTLTSVAKAYGVTVEWLIKRNRLIEVPKTGDNLIVPKK